MAISKRLAGLMDGEVGVGSELGAGSTFWFTARLGKGRLKKRRLLPDPDLRERRVLVVDDNAHARETLSDMLSNMTFRVNEAPSGERALAAISEADAAPDPYEIVFLDWQMPPGIDGIETARRITGMDLRTRPHPVIVTAYGREEAFREAEKAGIEITLVKPVNPSILFDAAIRALGGEVTGEMADVDLQSDADVVDLSPIRGARILLAEDNLLNQEVAMELLTDSGFRVDLAENGKVAVEMTDRNPYDAVLMDMQMPVMDGEHATREIRGDERFHDLPIIAMTANAMAGDRERCIAAGMNDHVAKPIDPKALLKTLVQWIPPLDRDPEKIEEDAKEADKKPAAESEIPEEAILLALKSIPGLDVDAGLKRLMGKQDFYTRMLRQFTIGEEARTVATVRAQLEAGDRHTAERAAHSLKGVAATLGASALQGWAAELERSIREKEPEDQIESLVAAMEKELARLIAAIQEALQVVEESPETAEAGDVDWEKARAVVARLEVLLEQDDAGAINVFEQSAPLIRAAFGDAAASIEMPLTGWDLPEALKALRATKRNRPELNKST